MVETISLDEFSDSVLSRHIHVSVMGHHYKPTVMKIKITKKDYEGLTKDLLLCYW